MGESLTESLKNIKVTNESVIIPKDLWDNITATYELAYAILQVNQGKDYLVDGKEAMKIIKKKFNEQDGY
jgi:hypothetical protein